jgi:ppGpp synthetase/RelA/SpoT-type nucleotidyltranferase
MELLIAELLKSESIIVHQINGRVKERVSLEKKIERKDNKYNNISEITDVIGIRIITYLESEVDKVAEILSREFTLDPLNSIDKRNLKADQFGYRSLHYVVSCSKDRIKLIEYKRFIDLKFEIKLGQFYNMCWQKLNMI